MISVEGPAKYLLILINLYLVLPARAMTEEHALWVGQFSQCSYNAVASVLVDLEGPMPAVAGRKEFETRVFLHPLDSTGYGAFYGWGPWTSYMVNSRKMVWSGHTVTDLRAERFSLCPHQPVEVYDEVIRVRYAPGERDILREKLLNELKKGPVIIWTPYAAVMGGAWHHVLRETSTSFDVPYLPGMTHSVTLFLQDDARAAVMDCSVANGFFTTDLDTIVSTAAAMTGAVERRRKASPNSARMTGVENAQYNVVFSKSPVATQAVAIAADADPDWLAAAIGTAPLSEAPAVRSALLSAGSRGPLWAHLMTDAPAGQRIGTAFLLSTLSPRDLNELDPMQVAADLSAAYAARLNTPWGRSMPEEVFEQAVLPETNLTEKRESWRPRLAEICRPLIPGCQTAGDVAMKLNVQLFPLLHVQYNAIKRPRPDQSPAESIAAGCASCTGLSTLLVDACRSVGVGARIVGTPCWFTHQGDANGNNGGNHTWVEIWDGQWHVMGAAEPGLLDQTWFMDNASKQYAAAADPTYRIYAVVPGSKATYFPMVWNQMNTDIPSEDVTLDYFSRQAIPITVDHPTELIVRHNGRLIADKYVTNSDKLILSLGQTYQVTLCTKEKKETTELRLPKSLPQTTCINFGAERPNPS